MRLDCLEQGLAGHHAFGAVFWELNALQEEVGERLLEKKQWAYGNQKRGINYIETYAYGRDTNSYGVQDDVKESEETGDPKREDDQNDQPNDEPENINHV